MTDHPTNGFESPEANVERAVKVSMAKELWEKSKATVEALNGSESLNSLMEEQKQLAVRRLALTGLAILEIVPGAELVNDASKWAGVIKKAAEIAPKIKKTGKIAGLIPDLYPDLPDWLVTTFATLDTVNVPFVGVGAELLQLGIDTVWNRPRNIIKQGGEIAGIARDNFFARTEYAQRQVEQAQLAFASEGEN